MAAAGTPSKEEIEQLLASVKQLREQRRDAARQGEDWFRGYLETARNGQEGTPEAMRILSALLDWFADRPTDDQMKRLRAMEALVDGWKARRARAVHVVRWFRRACEVFPDADPVRVAGFVAEELGKEPGLEGITTDVPCFAERLSRVVPARQRGGITAERFVAELIVEERDALGLTVDPEVDEELETERIRKILVRDVKGQSDG